MAKGTVSGSTSDRRRRYNPGCRADIATTFDRSANSNGRRNETSTASGHPDSKQPVTLGIDGAPDAAPDHAHGTLNLLRSDGERETVTIAPETGFPPGAGDPAPHALVPIGNCCIGHRRRKVMLYHLFSR